ncbi:MAG TPA: T9SS type A sorting domain-containing protein [Flavobacteriales bacterium]|nr:T9SS type A sorting domain-containing protein [Flavobacteriales bacterium]
MSSTNSVITQNDIKIFPNPFSDFTTILLNGNVKSHIQLFDISGRLLRKFVVHENSFQLYKNKLKGGIYFLQIQNKKGIFRKKLVIQ